MGTKDKAEKDELDELQEKIEENAKDLPKAEHPCPYCNQELPPDYAPKSPQDITLNLKDANIYGAAKAKEDRLMAKLDLAREDMNEFLQEVAEKHEYFNPQPGIDWDDGVLTGTDANNEPVKTDIEVDKEDIVQIKKLFQALQKMASKARRAVAERRVLLMDLAEKYGWSRFPCDVRNNKFVDITDEVVKRQTVNLEQIEQNLRKPKLADDKGK